MSLELAMLLRCDGDDCDQPPIIVGGTVATAGEGKIAIGMKGRPQGWSEQRTLVSGPDGPGIKLVCPACTARADASTQVVGG
jgi:hypothetical protein